MNATAFADQLGPRARRRVWIASALSAVAVAGVLYVALRRFADRGQLDPDLWRPFLEWEIQRFLLEGLVNTLRAALAAMALAMTIGAVMALGRLARNAPVRWLAGIYVEFFRGFPLLLLLLFSAFGLRQVVSLPLFWYLVLALAIYNSAVLAEIFRAGILSLDRGQSEAAAAIGLRYWQGMRLVILPQALRRMIPAIVSQLVTLLKDTSLGFFIQYHELLRRGQINGAADRNLLQSLIVVAAIYILVNLVLSQVARRLELRQRRRYGAGHIAVAGTEDLSVAVEEERSR